MTVEAFLPCADMRACVDGKEQIVMVSILAALAGGVTGQAIIAGVRVARHSRMIGVGFCNLVLMAIRTGNHGKGTGTYMALCALLPGTLMRSRKDWKKIGIVIFANVRFTTRRMTSEAGVAFVSISRYSAMLGVHFRLRVFMTGQTGKVTEGSWIGMTFQTVAPGAVMLSGEDWKKRIVIC